jgi:hypothetical protein
VPTGLKALTLRVAFATLHSAASGRIKSGLGLALVIASLDLAVLYSRMLGESLATLCRRPGPLLAASCGPGSAVLAIAHS